MNIIKNFNHYLVLGTIGYIIGLFAAYFLSTARLVYNIIFLIILAITFAVQLICCKKQGKSLSKLKALSLLLIVPIIIGNIRITLWNYNSYKILRPLQNQNALYFCKITSVPEKTSSASTMSANAHIFKITNDAVTKNADMNARLYFKESSNIGFGDIVKFYGKYTKSNDKASVYSKSKNQVAVFDAGQCIKTNEYTEGSNIFSDLGVIIRDKLIKAADSVYSYNSESASIVKAILTGDKNDFSPAMYDALADSGFLHVAAISGTHVSILFAILSNILLTLRLNKKTAVVISALAIILFSSVAAFTSSVLRASIMLIMSMLTIFANREYDSVTALFFSALVILIIYPYALFTSGFMLSFGATLGIILFYGYFSLYFKRLLGKTYAVLPADSIALSASAFIGTAPFGFYFFGNISLWSLVTNIWILPAVSVIFCIGFLSCAFYYIYPPIAFNIMRYLAEPFIFILIKTARVFSTLRFAIITPDYVPWCFYVYCAAFIFILLYILTVSSRKRRI